jgi:hypothetical protein
MVVAPVHRKVGALTRSSGSNSTEGGAVSHDRVEILGCDADGCEAELLGRASTLVARARAAGWQAREVADLWITDDGPEITWTDRCPDHHTDVVPREVVLREAGGPGGIQPWHLP